MRPTPAFPPRTSAYSLPPQQVAQVLERLKNPGDSPRSRGLSAPLPVTGQPRAGGRLSHSLYAPSFRSGYVHVTVEGAERRAIVTIADFKRITARDPFGPWLTQTRWWLDEDGFLRAFSMHDRPMTHGVLVASAILGAKEGDVIEVPADPLDMRLSSLRRIAA